MRLTVLLVWFLGIAAIAAAADLPTRAEYVAQLERICKPGFKAGERAVRGTRSDLRNERLALAARKLDRAKRIFTDTVGQIITVPRPEADLRTLKRWFTALRREEFYLGRMVETLKVDNIAGFQRVSADFIHQGNRANNAVIAFDFNYCSFKPARFQ